MATASAGRCVNALYVKERFGIAAPVHRGAAQASGPALGEGYPDFVHGRNGLGDIAFNEPALREEPLPAAEANIAGDPVAADAVFVSGMPLTVVGLDVTAKTRMDESFIHALRERAGDAGEFIYQTTRVYFDFYEQSGGSRECPIHDSSAVACLLAPTLYRTRLRVVRVATEGIAIGQTVAGEPGVSYVSDAWHHAPPIQVCADVDADAVRALYLDTLAFAGEAHQTRLRL